MRTEMRALFQDVRDYIDKRFTDVHDYIDERTRDMQTELLRGFAAHNTAQDIRFRKMEADLSNVDTSTTQRLGLLEFQVQQLTARLTALESGGRLPPQ